MASSAVPWAGVKKRPLVSSVDVIGPRVEASTETPSMEVVLTLTGGGLAATPELPAPPPPPPKPPRPPPAAPVEEKWPWMFRSVSCSELETAATCSSFAIESAVEASSVPCPPVVSTLRLKACPACPALGAWNPNRDGPPVPAVAVLLTVMSVPTP